MYIDNVIVSAVLNWRFSNTIVNIYLLLHLTPYHICITLINTLNLLLCYTVIRTLGHVGTMIYTKGEKRVLNIREMFPIVINLALVIPTAKLSYVHFFVSHIL